MHIAVYRCRGARVLFAVARVCEMRLMWERSTRYVTHATHCGIHTAASKLDESSFFGRPLLDL